jgi:hypothetical protein
VKFRAEVDGAITGLRFYKGSANTGTHVGRLWSSNGQQLASATFTNETASGWQTVSFAQPVPITANTTYVASYFAPNGRYAVNENYFTSSGVDSAPLRALRDGEAGGNGVYKYGTSGFPTDTYLASNYWVDVVFTPSTTSPTPSPSSTPPTVTARTPSANATGVGRTANVTATFSEAVTGVSSTTFTLKQGTTTIAAAVTYNATTRVATLNPNPTLAANTTYTVTLTNGIRNSAGNALTPVTWSFTTGS